MHHKSYLVLDEPYCVNPSGDPEAAEAGLTVNAPVIKIVKYDPPDEYCEIPYIKIYYVFCFVNSKEEFKMLDTKIHTEIVVDIPATKGAAMVGVNPINNKVESYGSWYSDAIMSEGDFTMKSLYAHLSAKLGFRGNVVCGKH